MHSARGERQIRRQPVLQAKLTETEPEVGIARLQVELQCACGNGLRENQDAIERVVHGHCHYDECQERRVQSAATNRLGFHATDNSFMQKRIHAKLERKLKLIKLQRIVEAEKPPLAESLKEQQVW